MKLVIALALLASACAAGERPETRAETAARCSEAWEHATLEYMDERGRDRTCPPRPRGWRSAEPDTFGWSATMSRRPRLSDCGNPYTTLVWEGREFNCTRDARGVWTMEETR